jgi:mono/diheme cytochrome c family protein
VNKSRKFEIALACILAGFSYAAARANAQPQEAQPTAAKTTQASSDSSEGEKRFQQNCGRCHNAPDELSPRVVKAVVRQMRVRAMLTEEDERLIVKFLAP